MSCSLGPSPYPGTTIRRLPPLAPPNAGQNASIAPHLQPLVEFTAKKPHSGFYMLDQRTGRSSTDGRGGAPLQGPTRVERAFRSLKTVDLHIRPIRHRVESRVRAHLFLCLLAYYVHWHLRQAWPRCCSMTRIWKRNEPGEKVLAAQPSDSAKRKKRKRLTEDGLPLQSLETLMAHLGTRARHQCRLPSEPDAPCVAIDRADPAAATGFELIRMFPGNTT